MDQIKEYFKRNNTVCSWWNPEKGPNKLVYARQERIVKRIVKEYNPKSILDVSAGKGRFARILSPNRDYSCLDISKQMLNCIKKKKLGVKIIKGDAESMNLSRKYDLILCAEALVHYPQPLKALSKMKEFLGEDGILIITTDNKRCIGRILKNLEVLIFNFFHLLKINTENKIFFPYTFKEYNRLFLTAGFKIKKIVYLSLLSTPIKSKVTKKYFFSPKFCKKFTFIDKLLEKIPGINHFCTYFIYLLEKNEN